MTRSTSVAIVAWVLFMIGGFALLGVVRGRWPEIGYFTIALIAAGLALIVGWLFGAVFGRGSNRGPEA